MRKNEPPPARRSEPLRSGGYTETQERILAAALELFAERGYAAASTAAIAERAGVAEKTIFANFTTKERLFDEVLNPAALQILVPEAFGGLRETLAASWGTAGALLDAFMHNRLAFVKQHPSKLKLLVQAVLLHPERTDLFVGAFREHLAPRVREVLRSLEASGEIRRIPEASLVRIVMSVTAGYMLARFVLRPRAKWDDEAEIRTMIDVLVNGLRPRGDAPDLPHR
jgi:AcrR family transcriptional regulator